LSAESGERFYAMARSALERQTYPPLVRYSITITAFDRGVRRTADYTASYLGRTNAVSVGRFSRQEKERPHVAYGTNVMFDVALAMGGSATLVHKQLNESEVPTDVLGIPQLAPNYTFAIARRADPAVRPTTSMDPTGLPLIGSVTTRQRAYSVVYAGSDHVGDADLAHLTLQPLRDPTRNRLREMWIDPQNCLPVRLRVAGNFTTTPASVAPWTITYRNVDGATYLDMESADAPLNVSGHVYDDVRITFSVGEAGTPTLLDDLKASFDRSASKNVLREPASAKSSP
jgi:hypothetical protein